MKLKRLIYVSKVLDRSAQTLSNIIITSIENNILKNITGILIRTDNYYIQAIEGSTSNIDELYSNIIKDERHTDTVIKYKSEIDKRIFEDWSMKAFFFDSFAIDLKQHIKEEFGLVGDQIAEIENPKNLLDLLELIYNYFSNPNKEKIYG